MLKYYFIGFSFSNLEVSVKSSITPAVPIKKSRHVLNLLLCPKLLGSTLDFLLLWTVLGSCYY